MRGGQAGRFTMADQRQLEHIGVEMDDVKGRRGLHHGLQHDRVPHQRVGLVRVQAQTALNHRHQVRRGDRISAGEQGHLIVPFRPALRSDRKPHVRCRHRREAARFRRRVQPGRFSRSGPPRGRRCFRAGQPGKCCAAPSTMNLSRPDGARCRTTACVRRR